MALTTIGAGLDLADNLVKLFAPSVAQEQKESLLNAHKKRINDIQAAGDALMANPGDRSVQLALGALHKRMLNACGYTATGVASINVSVPLDDELQCLTGLSYLALLIEANAVAQDKS